MTVQLFVVLTPADHSSPASCSVKCCEFSSRLFQDVSPIQVLPMWKVGPEGRSGQLETPSADSRA